jgi:hypothetical protein
MRQAVSLDHKIRPTTPILFCGVFPRQVASHLRQVERQVVSHLRQVVRQAVSRDRLAACLVSPVVPAVSRHSAVFLRSATPLFILQATPTHLVNYLSLKVSSYA